MSEIIQGMSVNYIILKFGLHRVLLLNRVGESATVSRPVDGGYLIFDYSACDVVRHITVADGDAEPTPDDILAVTRTFQGECDAMTATALLSAGCVPVDGPANNVKYLGMTEDGTQYAP